MIWDLSRYLNGEHCCENGCTLVRNKKDSCLRSKDGYCDAFNFRGTYNNVVAWAYAINTGNSYEKYTLSSDEKKEILKTLAVINIKKNSGVNGSIDDDLYYQTTKYKEYLIKQIKLIQPTVIVCGGTYGMLRCLFLELDDLCFPEYKVKNGYAVLENEEGLGRVKVIASCHPSYIKGAENSYNNIIENYRKVSQLCKLDE